MSGRSEAGNRPGSGGTGPLRREGRLSGVQEAGGRAADGTGGNPAEGAGRPRAGTGGRPPRRGAAPPPGTGGRPAGTEGSGSSSARSGGLSTRSGGSSTRSGGLSTRSGGSSTRRAARRRPTALPWRASNCSTVIGWALPGSPSRPRRVRPGAPRETPEPSAPRVGCSPTGVDTFSSSSLPRRHLLPSLLPTIRGDSRGRRRTRGTGNPRTGEECVRPDSGPSSGCVACGG
jgi:hypothetical protein